MPRYNVEHNKKWACFSSISDSFVTEFMEIEEYEDWRKQEYGLADYEPAENRNKKNIQEAVFSVRLNRNHDEALECLLECGLSESECEQLLFDTETIYYCPVPLENGNYKCPNCHKEVEPKQLECDNDTCCLEFVWRT